ncbi:MAG: autotransporter-associated beta strand repeat-containing protein [Luteolibacter sp.]|uniref:beta strand repeat-containing protein n=1 Tax=Luteolibacter sp. TaxID=1962973 RepID=UPI0032678A85
MKLKKGNLLCLASIFVSLSGHSSAAEIVRANVAIALNDPTAWVGGVVPGSADIARWDSTVTTGTNSSTAVLGADTTWGQIKVVNPTVVAASSVIIPAGSLLTLAGVSGTGIDVNSTQNLVITSPLTLSGNQEWSVGTGRTVTINGATVFDQGSSSITMNGLGGVLINFLNGIAAPTSTGSFTVNRGQLTVMSANSAGFPGHTNVLSPNTPLIMGGGTFQGQVGNSVGTYTQNMASLTINAGASVLTQVRGSSSTVVNSFGSITRNLGGTLNLTPTNNNSGFRVASGTFPIELVSGGITLTSSDFVRAATAATNMAAATYTADTWATGNRTNVTADSSQTGATTGALRFAAAGARTITLAGTNIIESGGLLVTSAVAANTTTISGAGTLAGAAGGGLIVHQHNTSAPLTISSQIVDNAGPTALTKTGAGTLVLSGNNSFTNGVYINQGSIQLGNPGALNSTTPNAVTFTNNSGGKLQLGGNNSTVSSLQTTSVVAVVPPVVENVSATNATLTVSNASAVLYAGTLQDGTGAGKLGLTKSAAGVFTLSGASTAFTGATTISLGTLALSGSAVPGTSNTVSVASGAILDVTARTGGSLTIANAQNLTGAGSVAGAIVTGSGSIITPGSAGVGTLTTQALAVGNGSTFNFEASTGSTDLLDVTGSNSLTIGSGSGINLYVPGTLNKLQTNGVYRLFKYVGTIQGAGVAALSSANILNPQGGLSYSFAENAGYVEVTVSGTPVVSSIWTGTGSGSWGDTTKWDTGTVPNLAGATATLNGAILAPSIVSLNGNRSVGSLVLNSAFGYTVNAGTPTTSILTLDNGAGNATIVVTNGSHTINTPVTLLSNTSVTVTNLADTLTFTGIVDDGGGVKGITKSGLGTLNFAAAFETPNTFSGGLTVTAGTVQFNALDSLGSDFITVAGGTLRWASGITDDVEDISTRIVTIGSGGAIFDTNGNDVNFIGGIGSGGVGGLTKTGLGTLTMGSGNDYTGGVTINAGVLQIPDDSGLGAVPGSPSTKITFNPGTGNTSTLKLGASDVTINANRTILMSSGTAEFDTNGVNGTYTGLLFGPAKFKKSGAGTLTVTGVNNVNATGGTVIDAGTIGINNESNLPAGTVTMNGTAAINTNGASFHGNYVINGTNSISENPAGGGVITTIGALTGTGSFTLNNVFVCDYAANSWEGFNGTINLGGGTRLNGTAGSAAVTLNLGIYGVSVRDGRTAIAIGEIQSPAPAGILGGSTGGGVQTVTWNIGGKNTNSLFGGVIGNGGGPSAINKVGSGSLTLSNTSNHTGPSTVSAGSLIFNGGGFSAGALTVAAGATLTGNATLAAVTVSANGIIAPGIAGIGTFSTGATVLAGLLQVEVDGTTNTADMLAVTGNLNLTGSTINFSSIGGALTQPTYIIGSYTTLTGTPTLESNVPSGYRVDYNFHGLNQIAITTEPADQYSTWASGFGLTGGNAPKSSDTSDSDGVANILEFILGGNPNNGNTSFLPLQNTSDPNTLVFSYNRADAALLSATEKVEVSADLSDWSTIPPITVGAGNSSGPGYTVVITDNGATDLVTVTIQRAANTKLFARLHAEF